MGSYIFIYGVALYCIHSCSSKSEHRDISKHFDEISSKFIPQLITSDTIGNKTFDKFYQIGTNRAYVEIDGKQVENYFLEEKR